jgi:ribose/xylose/arabinose/galactoside ABC-type transport system permease subunit
VKRIRYRTIRSKLQDHYFVPAAGSRERLAERLGVSPRSTEAERRFGRTFVAVLAATAALLCLANLGSVRPQYLARYTVPTVAALVRTITTPASEDTLKPLE